MTSKTVDPKFSIIQSSDNDNSITAEFKDEDHTLGNALRYIILKNNDVKFCGYSMPHPNEKKFLIQIQMNKNSPINGLQALERGLQDLKQLCQHIKTTFNNSVEEYQQI